MKFRAYIFDFDGTLVQSNTIKREAFYQLSPEIAKHRGIVDNVLSSIPEKSRFEIVRTIYDKIQSETGVQYSEDTIKNSINEYSSIVRTGVLACPEIEGATLLLEYLKNAEVLVYISSNTPEESLGELIDGRGWHTCVDTYFGFPKLKTDTVKHILKTKKLDASDVIVVGDGLSDEISARENGCSFYKISHDKSLLEFYTQISRPALYV